VNRREMLAGLVALALPALSPARSARYRTRHVRPANPLNGKVCRLCGAPGTTGFVEMLNWKPGKPADGLGETFRVCRAHNPWRNGGGESVEQTHAEANHIAAAIRAKEARAGIVSPPPTYWERHTRIVQERVRT
jgi:hypothetical protein